MAVVPVPDPEPGQVQAEGIAGRAYPRMSDDVSPQEFGAGVGRGLEEMGEDVSEIGANQQANAQRLQRQSDQVRVAQANMQIGDAANAIMYGQDGQNGQPGTPGAFQQRGDAAVNMTPRYLDQFDQQSEQIIQGMNLSPEQEDAVRTHLMLERHELGTQLSRYEAEEGQRTAQSTFSAAVDQGINSSALNWRAMADDDTYQLRVAQVRAASDAWADSARQDKKETSGANVDKLIGATTMNALADNSSQGVAFAGKFLEDHKGDLTNPGAYAELKEHIDAKQKELDNQREQGLSDKWNDALQGALNGIPGSTGLISHAEVLELYKKDGEQKWQYLSKAAQAGASEKQFDQMDPAAIQSWLEAHQPSAMTAHAGQAQDLELNRLTAEAAQRSLEKRSTDARQFLIDTQHQVPLDWGKLDQAVGVLNTRAGTAQTDAARIGVQPQLLSKGEAHQLSSYLANAPADQELTTLTKLRDGMQSPAAFRALTEQVRPDSPAIAEAALRMPRDPSKAPSWYNSKFDTEQNVALDILTGNRLLQPKGETAAEEGGKGAGGFKGGINMPPDEDGNRGPGLRDHFVNDPAVQGTFRGDPIAADQQYEAFKALYAAKIARAGDESGTFNGPIARQAIDEMFPHLDRSFLGQPVAVPRGMDPARFHDYVDGAVKAAISGKMDEKYLTAPKWLGLARGEHYGLIPIGPSGSGQFYVSQDGLSPMQFADGRPVAIDLEHQYGRAGTSSQQ